MPNSESEDNVTETKFNFGLGRQGVLRFDGNLWIEMGTGIPVSDLLIKGGAVSEDVQLRIERLEQGLEISLHGMVKGEEWGLPENAPRLRLTVHPKLNIASVYAVSGSKSNEEQILLEQMNLS